MKIILAAACFVFSVLTAVRADLTIVQKVQGLGQDTETTAIYKGDKIRLETAPGTSLIMDLRTGEMINLLHAPKTYLRVSSATTQAAVESMKATPAPSPTPRPALTATGKTETISGYPSEEYTTTVGGAKMTLWLTKALPNYAAVLREMDNALGRGPMGPLMQSYGVDLPGLPGFPIRTVLEVPPAGAITRTVLSVNTDPVAGAEFQIPPGYKEVSSPLLTPPAAVNPSPSPTN